MNSSASLRVRISADLADLRQGLGLLRGELATVRKQAERASPSATAWSKGLAGVRRQLLGIVSVYSLMRAGGAYVKLADEAANLSGRLKLATKSQQEFTKAQEATFRIAQETSSEWGSIIGLYSQLSQTTAMGQDRILALTKAISQAFTVSGASAQETANGLRQLQQAMAGGVLRAEEFNTIIETSPRIVQALADHFGIAFGEVRKHVNGGKVTSAEFAEALLKGSEAIQADFDKMPLTIGRAMQRVRNSLIALVGDADKASGASNELAKAIADFASVLSRDDVKSGFATLITGTSEAAKLFAELAGNITAAGAAYNSWLKDKGFLKAGSLETEAQLDERIRKLAQMQHGRGMLDQLRRQLFGDAISQQLREAIAERNRFPWRNVVGGVVTAGKDGRSGNAGSGNSSDKTLARSNALMRDEVRRALEELDRLYKAHEIGVTRYHESRLSLQQQGIDLQIQQARSELAATNDAGKRRDIEEQIVILQRDRADLAVQTLRDEKKAKEELEKIYGDAYLDRLENEGKLAIAVRARLLEEARENIMRLQAEGRHDDVRTIWLNIDTKVALAQLSQLDAEIARTLGRLQATEQSISAQINAGTVGVVAGEAELREARSGALLQLLEMRQAAVDALGSMAAGSPEAMAAQQTIQDLDINILAVVERLDELRNKVKDAATDALTNFFMDLVEGSKSAGDALRDFVRGFAMAMAQIAARALATMLVLRMMDTLWPGAGRMLAASFSVGQYHSGGIVGDGGVRRQLPAWMLGRAPRYHSGGIAGMAPDEVGAVLQRGEEVLTQDDPRHRNNLRGGAGGGTIVKTPVVVFGEQELANALAGHAGEQVVITHVRNNRRAIDE